MNVHIKNGNYIFSKALTAKMHENLSFFVKLRDCALNKALSEKSERVYILCGFGISLHFYQNR